MPIEGVPRSITENYEADWIEPARIISEASHPNVLKQLESMPADENRPTTWPPATNRVYASDSDIAQLWWLSRFDNHAHDRLTQLVIDGLCTHDDIAAVFYRMVDMGIKIASSEPF